MSDISIKRFDNMFIEYSNKSLDLTDIIYYGTSSIIVTKNTLQQCLTKGAPEEFVGYIGDKEFKKMLQFLLKNRGWETQLYTRILGQLNCNLVYYADVCNGAPDVIKSDHVYNCDKHTIVDNLEELPRGESVEYNFYTECWEASEYTGILDIPDEHITYDSEALEAERERRWS